MTDSTLAEFSANVSGKKFDTVNPADGTVITSVYEADAADVDIAVEAAKKAFPAWKKVKPVERGKLLFKLADLMERETEVLAEIESLDNGKCVSIAKAADLNLSIAHMRYYAGWADKTHGQNVDVGTDFNAFTRLEPFGVCGQIIPWNFPLLMLSWKWAPALITGNVIVMKTSEKTPLSALKMCELAIEAGFPPGVINVLSGFGPTCGSAIANHMEIKKIAFTGSTGVGRLVLEAAAKSNLKKVSLELGGKSPNIIFDDADIDLAIKWSTMGIYFNHGQCCCAGSRMFVQEGIYDKFVEKFAAAAQSIKVGNGFHPETQHGPIVDKIQFDRVLSYIEKGKEGGATCHVGGQVLEGKGYFVTPTLFTDVTDDMVIAQEEIFGPVVCAMKFKTVEEVIERANNSQYGLAAAIHTKDIRLAARMQAELEAGTVWTNCYNVFFNEVPFGGYKQSGIGREMGEYALREYQQVKTIISAIGEGI